MELGLEIEMGGDGEKKDITVEVEEDVVVGDSEKEWEKREEEEATGDGKEQKE